MESEVQKLNAYRRKIAEESRLRLTDAISMISDLENLCEAAIETMEEQENELEQLKEKKNVLEKKLEGADQLQGELKEYERILLKEGEVVKLLNQIKEDEKKLKEERETFEEERRAFEEDRDTILSEKQEAVEKAKHYGMQWKEAIKDRDKAIQKQEDAEEKVKDAENELEKLRPLKQTVEEFAGKEKAWNEERTEMEEDIKWYRDYAFDQDRKIKQFFNGSKVLLEQHYHGYLNNPEKQEEYKKRFPDAHILETEMQKDVLKEQKETGSEEEESDQDESGKQNGSESMNTGEEGVQKKEPTQQSVTRRRNVSKN